MKSEKYCAELGVTAACTLRLIDGAEYSGQDLFQNQQMARQSAILIDISSS